MPSNDCLAHWRDLYPFDSNFFLQSAVDSQGNRQDSSVGQHYIDYGKTDSNHTFLFVHGNPTWSFYWRNLVLGLGQHSRCVAVDHIGCGLSDKPQNYQYSLNQHIDNLSGLIRNLDLKNITLVAHDWGGAIGLGTLLKNKDRFARIALMNTGAFPPPYIPWQIQLCRIPIFGMFAIRGFNGFAWPATRMAVSRKGGLDQTVKQGLIAPYHDWETRIATHKFVEDIPARSTHPTWSVLNEIENGLTSLNLPVQLIWGMKDWCFRPDCLERFQKIFRNAKSHEISWANHYVVEDAPEEVLDVINAFHKSNP